MSEITITDENFEQHFHDVRRHNPKRGEVMARFAAKAELIDGRLKRDLIGLLKNDQKAIAATNVMRKLGQATEIDSVRICREMVEDMVRGLTDDEIARKIYEFDFEAFYYVKPELVPNDPHWETIVLRNLDEFIDKAGNKFKMKWKLKDEPEKAVPADI